MFGISALLILLFSFFVTWNYPGDSAVIVIPVAVLILIFGTVVRNKVGEQRHQLPVGSSIVTSFSTWVFVFILVTQHTDISGATGPVQYSGDVVGRSIFGQRSFALLGMMAMPFATIGFLGLIHFSGVSIREDCSRIAVASYFVALMALLLHPGFIPMV